MIEEINLKKTTVQNASFLLLYVFGANLFLFITESGSHFKLVEPEYSLNQITVIDHFKASIGAFLIGILIIVFEDRLFEKLHKTFIFYISRPIWNIVIVFMIVFTIFLTNMLFYKIVDKLTLSESLLSAFRIIRSPLFISFIIYFYGLSVFISFLRRLKSTFGDHVFYNYLKGNYHKPKPEQRTFFFLDLNDSTKLAEDLGHIKYSRMLNYCFDDIIGAVSKFKYEIYQFVGDEIVFTWPVKEDDNGKAIYMYKMIQNQLNEKAQKYNDLFGISPTFKGAVSSGWVTATVVGGKAKSIAYHGDVLNTAARMLGVCKKNRCDFIISQFYLKTIKSKDAFSTNLISTIRLRGKGNNTELYAINLKPLV